MLVFFWGHYEHLSSNRRPAARAFSEGQVRQSLAEGLIPSELPAWHDGLPEWVQVKTLVASGQSISAEPPDADPSSPPTADEAALSPTLASTPISSRRNVRWYLILAYAFGSTVAVAGLTVGAIHLVGSSHHFTSSTPEQTEVADSGQVTDGTGSAATSSPADIEEARAFIEKKLGQAWGFSTKKWTATVKIDNATGHIHIDYNGHYDCLLSSLDPDSIVEKKDANDDDLVIYTRDHARVVTVNHGGGQDEVTDRIELLDAPDKERLSKAFAFLINAFPPVNSATESDSGDLREKLCQELRSSLSADDSLLKSEVSYDKSTETVTAECFGRFNNMYGKLVIPIKQVDPQGIKWTQSGMDKSQMLLVTLDKQPAIEVTHRSAFNQGTPFKVGSYQDLYFPTENDAAEFADTMTQLCKELGWQPSKF